MFSSLPVDLRQQPDKRFMTQTQRLCGVIRIHSAEHTMCLHTVDLHDITTLCVRIELFTGRPCEGMIKYEKH